MKNKSGKVLKRMASQARIKKNTASIQRRMIDELIKNGQAAAPLEDNRKKSGLDTYGVTAAISCEPIKKWPNQGTADKTSEDFSLWGTISVVGSGRHFLKDRITVHPKTKSHKLK